MKIAVLGAGSFGCSIAQVLSNNNHHVKLWDFSEENAKKLDKTRENPFIQGASLSKEIFITSQLQEVEDCEMVVYVVPSFALRETAAKIKSMKIDDCVQVICTKGIEAETMKTGLEILKSDFEFRGDVVILSGPTHAEELALGKMTTIVSTCENEQTAILVQNTFSCEYLRVYTQTDVTGVEILGGAKNVLAMAAGVCDSHSELGDNAKAAVLTRGLRELVTIGRFEGAKESTFYGLTGMGDLIVTATSQHSRNRKFGELIGKGLTKDEALSEIKMTVEGIYSVQALHQLAQKHNLDLPLVNSIYAVLEEGKSIDSMLDILMDRKLREE